MPNITIYMPVSPPTNMTMQPLVWAEGGCADNGTYFVNFVTEIASHGFIVLANGAPNGTGYSTAASQAYAAAWIKGKAGTAGKYQNVNASRIAAGGQSCGGLLTYKQRNDSNVDFLGIFNSGFVPGGPSNPNLPPGFINEDIDTIKQIRKPIFYFLGGPTDVAQPNVGRQLSLSRCAG